MFDLVDAMRTRVITDPAFDGSRILGAILFEQTMERDVRGVPTARYLCDDQQVVAFLKVDKGLAPHPDPRILRQSHPPTGSTAPATARPTTPCRGSSSPG